MIDIWKFLNIVVIYGAIFVMVIIWVFAYFWEYRILEIFFSMVELSLLEFCFNKYSIDSSNLNLELVVLMGVREWIYISIYFLSYCQQVIDFF